MAQITKAVRDAVLLRLQDSSSGFNVNLALALAAPGYPGVTAFTVDWSTSSRQFFQGALQPGQLEDSTAIKYPLFVLYATEAANRNEHKFRQFAGDVHIVLDVWLSWRAGNALRDTETLGDAVEDAMFRTFNGGEWAASYGAPLAYNGDLALTRGLLDMAGEHWRQLLRFNLGFMVST